MEGGSLAASLLRPVALTPQPTQHHVTSLSMQHSMDAPSSQHNISPPSIPHNTTPHPASDINDALSVASSTSLQLRPILNQARELASKNAEFAQCFTYIQQKLDENRKERQLFRKFILKAIAHTEGRFEPGEPPIACWAQDDVDSAQKLLACLRKQRDFMYANLQERLNLANKDIERMRYIVQQRSAMFNELERDGKLITKYKDSWGDNVLSVHAEMQSRLEQSEKAMGEGIQALQNKLVTMMSMS